MGNQGSRLNWYLRGCSALENRGRVGGGVERLPEKLAALLR